MKVSIVYYQKRKISNWKFKNPKVFIDYSQITDDVSGSLEDYNPIKKRTALIIIDDIIADIKSNKKSSHIVTIELRISFFLIHSLFLKCLKL